MKYYLLLTLCFMSHLFNMGQAQENKHKYSTFYHQRASLFELLPASQSDILFVGNSITNGGEWYELFQNSHVKNRGISGDTTWGVYDRLSPLLKGHPSQIFLLIGINDIPQGKSDQEIVYGIKKIIRKIKKDSPQTSIFVQSILPVNPHFNLFQGHTSQWQRIPYINQSIRKMAEKESITYIDLYSSFADHEGKMDLKYTNDGLHLLGEGYLLWKSIITPYLNK